jgi:DNA ligase-1
MHTQILSTRARKDVKMEDIKVNVCVFMFDCLYLNGRSLLQAPLTERRQALYSAIKVRLFSLVRVYLF